MVSLFSRNTRRPSPPMWRDGHRTGVSEEEERAVPNPGASTVIHIHKGPGRVLKKRFEKNLPEFTEETAAAPGQPVLVRTAVVAAPRFSGNKRRNHRRQWPFLPFSRTVQPPADDFHGASARCSLRSIAKTKAARGTTENAIGIINTYEIINANAGSRRSLAIGARAHGVRTLTDGNDTSATKPDRRAAPIGKRLRQPAPRAFTTSTAAAVTVSRPPLHDRPPRSFLYGRPVVPRDVVCVCVRIHGARTKKKQKQYDIHPLSRWFVSKISPRFAYRARVSPAAKPVRLTCYPVYATTRLRGTDGFIGRAARTRSSGRRVRRNARISGPPVRDTNPSDDRGPTTGRLFSKRVVFIR